MAADERVHGGRRACSSFWRGFGGSYGRCIWRHQGTHDSFPGWVHNSPLSESLIVGESIGEALAGRRPVAFLQFADFLPIAYTQIVSELGSLYAERGQRGRW
ncbi:MAG: hypothetical protein LC641_14215 [Spirochaeta sp.]|nr:hypothetical protein [Spirochaeta sp.]